MLRPERPREAAAARLAQAPLPQARVMPEPRSHTWTPISSPLTRQNSTLVRSGNWGSVSTIRPRRASSSPAGKRVKQEGLDNNLLELIAADPAFHLTEEALHAAMDPRKYTGRAARQTEEFLAEVIAPILEENASALGMTAEIKV